MTGVTLTEGARVSITLPAPESRTAPTAGTTALVTAKETVADGVCLLTLADPLGRRLPDWTPGSHVDLLLPGGAHVWQDKLQLTGFEKATGLIDGGDALKVFDTGTARLALSVCYDIEFPLPVRAQYEAGARLLLVPSCTDTAAGATRVRVGCQARALENRCFVAQAVTAGEAPWSPALDVNTGEAALIAPMDVGLPSDGMLVQTRGDDAWAIAELDFDALEASRAHAQVANDRDWPAQYFPTVQRARLERALHHASGAEVA